MDNSNQPTQTSLGVSTAMGCLHLGLGTAVLFRHLVAFTSLYFIPCTPCTLAIYPHSLELVPTSLSFRAALLILGFAGDTISASIYHNLRTPDFDPETVPFLVLCA
jgi:hypothetical protein